MLRPYACPIDPARHQRGPARPAFWAFLPDAAQIGPVTLFATKPIATLRAEAETTGEHALTRALGPLNLVSLGIGAVIGAGIFVITGQVAALYAGPAVPLSMIAVGVACAFAGLCYAEMASAVPVAGSAYTYAYATMGEFAAWIIGWDLVLEYAAGAATVGVGWSAHFVSLLGLFGVRIPASLTAPPTQLCTVAQVAAHAGGCAHAGLNLTGAIINLPAVLVVVVMSAVLVIGIRESARVNSVIVILKVAIVLLVVLVSLSHVRRANWTPFIPRTPGSGARTAGRACCAARVWCSSPTSGSTRSRPRRRNRRTRNETCPSASSARSRSARSSTWWCRPCWSAWSRMASSTSRRRWHMPWSGSAPPGGFASRSTSARSWASAP